MTRLAEIITAINGFFFSTAKWLVYAIAFLMVYEVIARYSLHSPTSWAPELARLIFGPFFLLGGPYLLHLGGHVAVDLVSDKAQGWLKRSLVIIGFSLAFVFGAMLFYFGLPQAIQSFEYNETTYSSWNPYWWPAKAVLPLAALLLCLQALAEITLTLSKSRKS